MTYLIALLLAANLLAATVFISAGVSAHLDADRVSATELRQAKALCVGPRFKKIGAVV